MPVTRINGNGKPESSYLQYLPPLYGYEEFMLSYENVIPMEDYLLIYEDTMRSLESTINNMALYFDPLLTPEPLLHWLAFWMDLVLDSSWPIERRRELVKSAAELYRWRGTRRGLTEYLRIYTDSIPEISEYIPGMSLDNETKLGINTKLGSSGTGHHFTVSIELGSEGEIDTDTIRSIIDSQKPAHTSYTLQVRKHG